MPGGKCYIGTSGWSYAHWAKGRFYPQGLKQGEWLRFFSGQFSTVELNSSFYRLPRPEFVARWRSVTGGRFRFAVKLWRRITHVKRLLDCERELADFLAVANEFGPKRGPLLVQLPPSLRKDAARLDEFLTLSKKAAGRTRWKVAVEFRNPDWLCDEVYALLTRHKAALCLADLPRCPITEPNDAPFVYVRRHGPGGGYRGCYTSQHIAADAAQVRRWLADGRNVYVYYNNDIGGHAVDNARQLMEAVGS
jgi:uncharacterized protein YecE (DUF72 family)